jgi:response regulator RpfG family c-di-GMP phosphodiesterase
MPFPAKASPQSHRKKLILCIDDHHQGVRARKLILEAAGYRVLAASSGTIGLRLLRRHRVRLAETDVPSNPARRKRESHRPSFLRVRAV